MDRATSTYAYDGDGKRASKTVAAATTNYVYDVNRSLPVVLDDAGRKYVWGLGLAYSVEISGGTIGVYHTDGLGSVRAVTDITSNVAQTYQTDEFGLSTLTQGTSTQPFGYTAEQRDAESGFMYLRRRMMYEPGIGRFLQRDRRSGMMYSPETIQSYAYARNNPVGLTDPSGLCEDPGGPGIRYCIERYIPYASVQGSKGDDRGPSAEGGSYRIRQFIRPDDEPSNFYYQASGNSELLGASGPGQLSNCYGRKNNVLEGREFELLCEGTHGVLGFAPPIQTTVFIREWNPGRVEVTVCGTPFPSLEVWQYGGPGGPQLLFNWDVRDKLRDVPVDLQPFWLTTQTTLVP